MNPELQRYIGGLPGIPRVSGDEPDRFGFLMFPVEYSPRERG